MNFNKLTISDLVDQQLPEFVVNEFPIFVKFFEEYYKSLELSGGLLDITNNFLDYKNIDNLRKYNLVTTYKLQQAISTTDQTIVLDSLDGLPSENGLISIGDEIILYETVNLSSKTLLNCKRGYTATTNFNGAATTVESTVAASHQVDDIATNLSSLVLFLILRNYEHQYLAGFPFENISSSIDKDTLIRNIKDFYNYKGTDISIEFLFRALFDEEITVKYPKDYVIKSSYSDFTVDDIIKVEAIQGNPYDLVGNELFQTNATGSVTVSAIIDQILINNISNYASANKNVYECRLNVLSQQFFEIPKETILRGVLASTDSVITVDSTIGFPPLNGIIQIDDEVITYRYKTFNQFIDCGRGTYNTVAVNHADLSDVKTTEFLYGYSGGIELESNKVSMRLLGVSSSVTIDDGGAYFEEFEKVELSPDGDIDFRPQFTTWIKNETGTLSSSSDIQIDANVNSITTEVSNIYKDDNYAYIISSGLPGHPIGSFIGTGFNVNNQNLLKLIPLSTEKNTQIQYTGNKAVGLFNNGVEAFSSQDYEDVPYGNIEKVEIIQKGFGFETNIQPIFRIPNATGAGATFNANITDGKVFSISVDDGGNGYTQDQSLEVTYGFDATATIVNDLDIVNGSIKSIAVTNPGQDYVAIPNVEIIDTTGKGTGAFAIAEITNNQLTGVVILNGGVDYSDKDTIVVNIISKGSGVVANAIVKKWSFDRVFKTRNSIDGNGNWAPAQTIKSDTGNGYLYPSRNVAYNLQYAYPSNPRILRHSLSDNVQGVNANYNEKISGFVHSPILGWAYDGNPIYGPYGYLTATVPANGISRQTSSYLLKTTVAATRPSVVTYPLGSFIDDYEFIQGTGSLDINNGRFCITPEYPEGRYCYFLTVDSFGGGIYPYIVGQTYYSVPAENNFNIEFNQQNEDNLNKAARRIRSSSTPSKGFDAILSVSNVERGVVDSFIVKESQAIFKTSDYLYLDNDDTEGSRAFGRVDSIKGQDVTTVSYQVSPEFSHPQLTTTNGIPDSPWPVEFSAPYLHKAGITYDVTVETSTPHLLSDNDIVTLTLDKQAISLSKTFNVRVSNYQTVKYIAPVIESTLVVDVAFNQTTINVDNSNGYRENDYLKINDEILKIVSIDYGSDQITVERTQFNSPLRLHASTNKVELYIPDDQPDYRLTVGSSITSTGVSGTIYSIDKENSTIEIRVDSGTLTDSSVLTDASSPSGRDLNISSISDTQIYWEFDPTGTGNHYVRDLSHTLMRGTEYIFDLSDGSIFGYSLIFSEDSANINSLTGVTVVGTAGTSGSTVTITKEALLNLDVSRVYYYEQNDKIINNKDFLSVLTFPDGVESIKVTKVVNDYSFKYTTSTQPEQPTYTGLISYTTTSQTAVGEINTVDVIDGGEGYKKLPRVAGVIHSELDSAKLTYSITGGSFDDTFSVLNSGNRYSSDVKLAINTSTGSGAVITPTIVGGKIISIKVDDAGKGYDENDTITVIDAGAKIFPVSNSIGKIKTIRFNNSGSQFNPDRTFSKSLVFKQKVIITDISGGVYKLSENVSSSSGLSAKIEKIREIGTDIYLLDLKINSGIPKVGDTLTGAILQVTSTIYSITNPDIIGNISGFISKVGFFDSDLGKISASSQKITDSYYYQDFSYVIRSTKSLSDYKKYVDETTHPLGFKLFGEVSVENDVDFDDTVTGSPFSIGLADDHSANEVIITLPNVNVESDIVFKKYEVSTLNTTDLKAYRGVGAARLNFLDNQIEAVQMADLSADFDVDTQTYTLTTNDGNFPLDTYNTSILLSLNDIFQEPFQTSSVIGISYVGGIATITTAADHNLATTSVGQTYPNQKYIHISAVTNTGNLNFNDKFEVYDVPSTNTIRVLFENPNGYLTNNDPDVCADVRSTIDSLINILTYQLNNPTVDLPTNNTGIWLDEEESTVVSANRHRDGAKLIDLNRFEIIDRANAEISLQYPDFYYPNDPQTSAYSKAKDAYRLIQQNRKELIDRGAGEIAVQHPDFVYPGDPATDSSYRFKDAYRLIQQNHKEIVDKAAAQIGVSFPDYIYPGDPATDSSYRFKDAYRLIQQNRTEIINNAWTDIITQYPSHGAYETKCRRDLGLFIDYTSLDLVNGGNEYARKFSLQFFDDSGNPLGNGIVGEEEEAIYGFNVAKDNMILAFRNQLTIKDTTITNDPNSPNTPHTFVSAVTNGVTSNAGNLPNAVTGATYDPSTGEMVITSDDHLLTTSNTITIADNAISFRCNYGNTNHTFVSGVTNAITPDVGSTVTAASGTTYDAATGDLVLEIGSHTLTTSNTIQIADGAVTFTCDADNNVTQHSYPRATDPVSGTSIAITAVSATTITVNVGSVTDASRTKSYPRTTVDIFTATDASYSPTTGIVTVTVDNHGFENGDFVKIADDSLTFTCEMDGDATNHTYPRSSDPISGQWLEISNVDTDTFSVDVGTTPLVNHNVTGATYDGTTGDLELTIGSHSLTTGQSIKLADNSLTFSCNAAVGAHTFKSGVTNAITPSVGSAVTAAAGTTYDPTTGNLVLEIGSHSLTTSDTLTIANGGVTFSCAADNHATDHAYPRATDPVSGTALAITNPTATTVTVNVGIASATTNNQGTYPRASGANTSGGADYAYNTALPITGTTGTTITINVNGGQGAISNLDAHTFVSATSGAVITGGNYTHTFVSATADGVSKKRDIAYQNTLTISAADTNTFTINVGAAGGALLCANIASSLTTLSSIATSAFTAGSISGLPAENIGTDTTGEAKCKRDLGLLIDYSSIDLVNGGNEYTRKFVLQYFDNSGNPINNGLQGEEAASIVAFNFARDEMIKSFTNELLVKDLTITADSGSPLCANITSNLTTLIGVITTTINAGSTTGLPAENIGTDTTGEAKCKRDIGMFIDAVSLDIHTGGNVYARKFLKKYFNDQGTSFISNGLSGEILESNTAFNKVRDLMKQAIVNQLLIKDLTITAGNASYWGDAVGTPTDVTYDAVTGVAQVTIVDHGLNNGDDVVIKSNGLTFNCGMDGNVAEKSYPRLADGNHEQSLAISNVTSDTFDITVGASPEKTFTISDANYDPVSGDLELTIGNHSLRAGTSVKIEPESLTFTCDLDNNQTEHRYPKTDILSETVTDASYDPVLGVLTVTVNNHGWNNGDLIKFDNDSLIFTCGMDGNATNHSYPRSTDPFSGKWIPIYAVTGNTFRVAIGVSSNTSTHTFVSAVNDGLKKKKDKTFDTAVSIITKTATTITINVGSSTDTSDHTYVPRLYTVTDATYDATTGILGITSNDHGFVVGDNILLGDDGLTFTCTQDDNVSFHSYPRSTDPASKRRSTVLTATDDHLTVNIGSSPIVNYTPTNATYDSSTGLMEVTIGTHGIKSNATVKMLDDGITFTCGAATGTHTFVSGVTNAITPSVGSAVTAAAGTTYDPSTGVMTIEIGSHSLTTSDTVQIANGGVTFTCDADAHATNHAYPRSTDPASGSNLAVLNPQATTIDVQVGVAADPADTHSYPRNIIDTHTPGAGTTYDPVTGLMIINTGTTHGIKVGDWVKFDDGAVTFRCDEDSQSSDHAYPRATDPVSGKWLQVSAIDGQTFTVKVLTTTPSTNVTTHVFQSGVTDSIKHKRDRSYNQPIPVVSVSDTTITLQVGTTSIVSAHTFVSALTDAIISGGDYPHTFVSAASNALNQSVVISGGEYPHTFIRAVTDAIVRPVVNAPVSNNSDGACADIKSNIDNLAGIVTLYLSQGSLNYPQSLPAESVRILSAGEAKCKRDLSLIVDSVIGDLRTGGNSNIRSSTQKYLDGSALLSNGLAGEVNESITAFEKARDMMSLAICNQLYIQDLTILDDFLTTSGTIESSSLTNATFTEGQFEYSNAILKLYEPVRKGTVFHSTFFKFVSAGDDARYSYKLKNILFDGISTDYPLYKINGSNVTTEADENLLVFIDGVLQLYGESYTIDRSVNPNVIKFTNVIEKDRHFFSYTFSKYKILNNFADQFNSSQRSFEFKFGDDNILPPDDHQMLIMLDGVPQVEGSSYTIVDNVITFTEAPTTGKKCFVLYFYGKVFEKTISIWNGEVFENLEYIGDNSPEGCKYLTKVANTGDIIKPGDKIRIDGESVKEIIRVEEKALKNTDNLVYTALIYTDNAYVRGKNAVANAVIDLTASSVSGGNPVGIDGTIGVENTMGIPTVFAPGPITSINITNPGLEYDVAPIILFKTECDNPGTGAEAIAQITNGKVTNVIITNPGSGYTEPPELIFAKKYEIIRPHTPLYMKNNTIVDISLANALLPGFSVSSDIDEEVTVPLVISQLTSSNTTVIEMENQMIRNTSEAGLAYNLQTFDNNKFSYEPHGINDPLASYLGTGVTIQHMNRYAPALTVGDFTTHRAVSQGATEPNIINIGPEAYVSYGLTLNGNINDTVTTITVTGDVSNFPPTGYLEFGDEIVEYTSISGQDFTVVRGVKGTTATSHTDTDYLRLAWRG